MKLIGFRFIVRSLMFATLCLATVDVHADSEHSAWNKLLKKYVTPTSDGFSSEVDYTGLQRERAALLGYLRSLEQIPKESYAAWSARKRLAFLINAYNAWTVELVLTSYPDLQSIKDLGTWYQSPWKVSFIPLLGQKVSLDTIEHEWIRESGDFNEPRVHFALNCASVGCPGLRPEAYASERIDIQLEEATHLFLRDRSRNRFKGGKLQLSPIFKWYQEDFEQGWRGARSLMEFAALYRHQLELSDAQLIELGNGKGTIEFNEYDWALNDRR